MVQKTIIRPHVVTKDNTKICFDTFHFKKIPTKTND